MIRGTKSNGKMRSVPSFSPYTVNVMPWSISESFCNRSRWCCALSVHTRGPPAQTASSAVTARAVTSRAVPRTRTSRLRRELLERMSTRQPAADREGVGDLAHVDVAPRIHRDAVGRGEAAGSRGVGRSPARQQAAVLVEDADAAEARFGDRPVALRRLALVPPQLGDVGAALWVEHDVGGPLRVGPLAQVLAVRAIDLDPVVLPIADEDPSVGGRGDAVGQVELAGALAGHAPRPLELAGR